MGGRGQFVNVVTGDFSFIDNGQTFIKVGEIDGVHILIRQAPYSVKAPEYSHTENRIYAISQDGKLKHLAYYDKNHKQIRCVDFEHEHGKNKLKPHVHENMIHNKDENGIPPNEKDMIIAKKIMKWLREKNEQ